MPTKIGFTGTQRGMTERQKEHLAACLAFAYGGPGSEFHHGDCINSDAEAVEIALGIGYQIHTHPPDNDRKRAFAVTHIFYPPKPYLDRNQDIVDAVDELYATPATADEQLRSGTWATVRRARKRGIKVEVLEP